MSRAVSLGLLLLGVGSACGGSPTVSRDVETPARVSAAPTAREDRFDPSGLPPIGAAIPFGGAHAPVVARVHLIDVGQGAATLIELSCAAILVDTGGEASDGFSGRDALRTYLESFFARRPDLARTISLLAITHAHVDHTRNVKMLVEDFSVDAVITDGRTTGSGGSQQRWLQRWAAENVRLEAIASEAIPAGGLTDRTIDPIRCKDVDPRIRALWGSVAERPAGWTKEAFEDENNHSIVLRVDVGRASFLTSGDLETEGLRAVLAKHEGTRALDVDVLQVGHHGSANGTTKPWLDATTPSIALVPAGPATREAMWTAWAYGHPRADALDLWLSAPLLPRRSVDVSVASAPRTFHRVSLDKAVYATGWDGDVVVSASEGGLLRVQTSR